MESEDDLEDSYPEPQEEEPDLGPPYTSEELHREVGTVPSRSLLDSLLESSASRYHHNVILLLLETRTLLRTVLSRYCKELTKYVNDNKLNGKQLKQAEDAYNVLWRKERDEMTGHMRQIVAAEQKVWQTRDEAIRQWVDQNAILETINSTLEPPIVNHA